MHGFDQLWIWDDPNVAGGLGWYRDVACGAKPAKFRIARSIAAETPRPSPATFGVAAAAESHSLAR